MANMLSTAKYNCEEEMEIVEVGEHNGDEEYTYNLATNGAKSSGNDQSFREDVYIGKLRDIGIYLNTMRRQENWSNKIFRDIRHQSYGYLLRDCLLWKRPKKKAECH